MPIGKGGRPCFLGSTSLGRCHLGNLAIWLRDSTVYPRGIACLPRGIIGGITCLSRGIVRVLPAWELLLGEACEALSLAECLTTRNAWGRTTLSVWERVLSLGKPGSCLPETALSAWERMLSTREAWELPAWEIALSARGRALSGWEVWGEALGVIDLPAWELLAACKALVARVTCLLFAQGKAWWSPQ